MPVGDIKGNKISRMNPKTKANYNPLGANQKPFIGS